MPRGASPVVTVRGRRYSPAMSTAYLVTGASRGLGAELVRQLRACGATVLAAVRDPDTAGDVARSGAAVVRLDVDRPETFETFAAGLDRPIDVLVNNAGIAAGDATLAATDVDTFDRVFRTNVFGPVLLARALLPALRRGTRRVVANMSSSLGSLAGTPGGFSYAYCASKAALNMTTVLMHRELAGEGFTVVSLDPGWNRTDMGGAEAPLDPVETMRAMAAQLERLDHRSAGAFLGWDDRSRPW